MLVLSDVESNCAVVVSANTKVQRVVLTQTKG
jgi:hypothetical protein